jgi:hypothetical protein
MRTGAVEAAYLALEWSDLALPYPLQRCTSVAVGYPMVTLAYLAALDPPI